MHNTKFCRFLSADCGPQPQHKGDLDTAGTVAGEGSYGSLAGTLLDRNFAHCSNNLSKIDVQSGERLAGHDRERPSQCGDPACVISSEIASATEHGRNSHGAATRHGSASPRISVVESPRELRHVNDGATPLPDWVRAARPSRAGMFIPGFLTALAVLAAANGILSTVLELTWL